MKEGIYVFYTWANTVSSTKMCNLPFGFIIIYIIQVEFGNDDTDISDIES